MTEHPPNCTKCDGKMEQGFILDFHRRGQIASQWAPGSPKKPPFFWFTIVPDETILPVGTFRCNSCGYLEQYARPEFAWR